MAARKAQRKSKKGKLIGRPRGSVGRNPIADPRRCKITVMFNSAELRELTKRVAASEYVIGEYIRRRALGVRG